MGNKIKGKYILGVSLFCSVALFLQGTGFAYEIPAKTLEIAGIKHAQRLEHREIKTPTSQVIRVGIGNQAFNSYNYKEISLYGTDLVEIYDGNKAIGTFTANKSILIKLNYSNGLFEIYSEGQKVRDCFGPVHLTSKNGLLGIEGLKRAGKPALYHGAFEIVKSTTNGFFNLVNMVEVEEYLKGVVPNEMPVRFGLEALKAQSVTARNYVLSPRIKSSPNYDVVDSVASQVYYGANTEKDIATQAVKETEGIVALYDWELILAQYSSTAGGYTEDFANAFSDPKTKEFPSKDKPYLKAKPDIPEQVELSSEDEALSFYSTYPDAFDMKSPYFRWTREWTVDELRANLEQTLPNQSAAGFVHPAFNKGDKLGKIENIIVKQRGKSGKIIELVIKSQNGDYHLYKELMIRRAFIKDGKALPSANVVFVPTYDSNGKLASIKGFGGGYGHGVGMSQFGAGFMAQELGKNFKDILFHYYTDITLGTKPVKITGSSDNISQSFYADKDDNVYLVVDNKDRLDSIILIINGKAKTFPLTSTIFGDNINRIELKKFIKHGSNQVTYVFSDNLNKNKDKELRLYIEIGRENGGNSKR